MKFNDGFWLHLDGVKPYYAVAVQQTSTDNDALKLQVCTVPLALPHSLTARIAIHKAHQA